MSSLSLQTVLRRIFVHNFSLKFIAAVLTLALYIWVSEDRETVVASFAPVRIVVPENQVLVSDPLDRVKVTIRGRWSDINRFDPSNLEPIRLDLTPADSDSIVTISGNMVRVPPGLRVVSIEPSSMYVELEPEAQRVVPIIPQTTGEPQSSYVVEGVDVSPARVTIRGPRSRLERINSVQTEPVDVGSRSESFERNVQLRVEDGLVRVEYDSRISVRVRIGSELITRTLEDVPITGVNTSLDVNISPATTSVSVRGPRGLVEALNPDVVRAEIDLSDEDRRPPGTFSKTVEIQNLPPGVEMTRVYPDRFRVITTER
ncbi:YbbR-like domain-containing protein [Bradymonadaceae bacterium TMQ3]|uniref:YbbR-like domain-containing protein n=1 Tax=Lujinxingia sediminis TaxID=2480984 RepID=A0ABY0CTX6_9DELT|nr:CdaR family protein [Lujinxingia sediminis]RDV38852.1 YbbR-like domain-containing protein [Bradymonadaceae bacterium TMQ3]RVU44086.1 YbbR-like domain-containing protein [Lujinxingia sediminis]TXC76376.1 hypothetical protein FRC91_06445 [Bradymonadales bacterium TMQ1]